MIRSAAIVLLLLLAAQTALAQSPGVSATEGQGAPAPGSVAAPEDFRGARFGAALEDIPGLKPVSELMGRKAGYENVYYRPDEKLTFGQADILSVGYIFRENRLTSVTVAMRGEENVFLVQEQLIREYGPGRQVGARYGWTWPTFSLVLAANPGGGVSVLTYTLER